MVNPSLSELLETGLIRPMDLAFGQFIASLETESADKMGILSAMLSMKLSEQNTCLSLESLLRSLPNVRLFDQVEELKACLLNANTVAETDRDGTSQARPLVLDGERLYLQRYWRYEQKLARQINHRTDAHIDIDLAQGQRLLDVLFPASNEAATDWQKVAVCVSATRKLSVITGGPGTGKTTTVTRLLALLQGLAKGQGRRLNMHLVAPTGKAAARLSESLLRETAKLPSNLGDDLPSQCSTIHRLLGAKPYSPYFRHHETNPLHTDVLVVDEASMVDLPLMSKLFDAVPPQAQIILLGDKDQLSSVEAGSVLADICRATAADEVAYSAQLTATLREMMSFDEGVEANTYGPRIADAIVMLRKSRRYDADSGVGQLAKAMNRGDFSTSASLLRGESFQDIVWRESGTVSELVAALLPCYRQMLDAVRRQDVRAAFDALSKQQVLCAQKSGIWGVVQLNQAIESELSRQGAIDRNLEFYPGRPVMLSQNDHSAKLYNGDIGICMLDPNQSGIMKIWFLTPQGDIRGVLPSRLPPHDTVFAMTIHKSQGSEFGEVHLCLPQHALGTQLISRELLYTGLTRARNRFVLHADVGALKSALARTCERSSGLSDRLL